MIPAADLKDPKDREAAEHSIRVIQNLESLENNEPFRQFMERMKAEADTMADKILHDESMSIEEREKMRVRRLGILDVLKAPIADKATHVRILETFGVLPLSGGD